MMIERERIINWGKGGSSVCVSLLLSVMLFEVATKFNQSSLASRAGAGRLFLEATLSNR